MRVANPTIRPFLALLILLASTGCDRIVRRKTSEPEFSGRIFAHDQIKHKLYEVTRSTANGRVNYVQIGDSVLDASISPDHKFLLYHASPPAGPSHKDDRLILRELSSGQEKVLISGVDARALSWATDSSRFSYHAENALHVSDLAGKSETVYQAPHATYNLVSGQTGRTTGSKEMYAPFARGRWISPDRIVFQRYDGEMPHFPQVAWNQLFVEPNVTTVAVLGSKTNLVNADKKWIVRAVCAEKSLLLLSEDYRRGPFYLTSATSDLRQPELRTLPAASTPQDPSPSDKSRQYDFMMIYSEPLGFVPGSCQILSLQHDPNSKRTMASYVDPATLVSQSAAELRVGEIKSWIFAPDGKKLAMVHDYSLSIVSLGTREVRSLDHGGIEGGTPINLRLVGWVP